MRIVGTGKRVRIYVGEQDRAPGESRRPLWETILSFLRGEGAAGATVLRGMAGFGAHSRVHVARFADVVPDLPIIIEWIDGPERVERLLPRVCQLVASGTITVEEVGIARYTHRDPRPLPPDSVAEVMTRDVVTVQPGTPLGEVVRLMLERDLRSLPVVDAEQRLVGIITNQDLVNRGGLGGRLELLAALGGLALERELADSGARARTAGEVMTREVASIERNEPLAAAAHRMVERRVKRLPVVDPDGRLVGMLSRVDVLRTIGEDYPAPPGREPGREAGQARVVGELARPDVPTLAADAALGEVLDAVTSTRLNRALVVDRERRVLGVISDADLLARLDPAGQMGLLAALMGRGGGRHSESIVARDLIPSDVPVVSVPADAAVAEAARRMLASRHKVLPVVDADGRLLGAVDRADLLGHLA